MGMLLTIFKSKAIFLIVLLGFLLRFINIDGNPKSMYGDSLTLVYDAYSILKTGMDQTGQHLPLYFSMGGGRPAAYIYATIPFVALLGPTALAARFVSILSGIGVIILLYLICKQIFSKKIGLLVALLASITPWELSLSRGAFESHFALFLGLLGLYFFLQSSRGFYFYLISSISFALAIQTYSTYVLIIPLFTLVLLYKEGMLASRKIFFQKGTIFFLSLILTSSLLSFYISYSRGSKDRFSNLQIFNQPELQNTLASKVRSERSYSLLSPELAIRFHNRILETFSVFSENYVNNFGLRFLFLQGDENPRHNPAVSGELFWFYLPLLIFGAVRLQRRDKRIFLFIFFWLLIAPLAASLVGKPHALRNSFMLPPLLILCANGFPSSKRSKIILCLLFLIQLPLFLNRFYFLSPNMNAKFWSYSAKLAAETAIKEKKNFDTIILSTSIPDMEYAYPVYAKIDPGKFINESQHKKQIGEYNFIKLDNVYLGSIPTGAVKGLTKNIKGSVLYLGPVEDIGQVDNEGIKRDEDEQPLFVISKKSK